jgi:hypothetical protein
LLTLFDMARALGAFMSLTWLAVMAVSIQAVEPITMSISPVCYSPGYITIRLRIEPHADNRAVQVSADSEEFYRSSFIPLEGDRAPRTLTVRFHNLPGGEYTFDAVLTDTIGRTRGSVQRTVLIIQTTAM